MDEASASYSYDAFISYRRVEPDRTMARQLRKDLMDAGYKVAIDAAEFRANESALSEIERCIKESRFMLSVVTPRYFESGNTVQEQIIAVTRGMRDRERRLIPLIYEKAQLPDSLFILSGVDFTESDPLIPPLQHLINTLGDPLPPPAPNAKPLWNVPPDNPTFSGRESILDSLHAALQEKRRVSLTGMPGVGKTQIAIQYARQPETEYSPVFWINAASDFRDDAKKADAPDEAATPDSRLTTEYSALSRHLRLPDADDPEVMRVKVIEWLDANPGWLLVFDNADDSEALSPFLPSVLKGYVLVTTREPGRWEGEVEVPVMEPDEGAECLLRCATMADPTDADRDIACDLSAKMGGLPLALDQAGAYVKEKRIGLSRYRDLYEKRSADLLKRRDRTINRYFRSVYATFTLAFDALERENPASAELLRLCAFLVSDAIPEEIFTEGASALEEPLASACADEIAWEETVETALRYALLRRDDVSRMLSVHRLVQETTREEMTEDERRDQATRCVLALNEIYPSGYYETWAECERLITQAQASADMIHRYGLIIQECGRLLNDAGLYLKQRGRNPEAERMYVRALSIYEEIFGASHPYVAASLNNLAELYCAQSRYEEAEPLYTRALAICEERLGASHPYTAISLSNLAGFYRSQNRYEEAEPPLLRALAIDETNSGVNHPDAATSLNALASLYYDQSRYAEAEPLFLRALTICEENLGASHPDTAQSLNNLAALYRAQGRYVEAEPLYERALAIIEESLGASHPYTSISLNNLAELFRAQERYAEAEALFLRALAIREESLGANHPGTATSLNNLALLYANQERYAEAEPLLLRALAITEESLGASHPDTATSLNNLAVLYKNLGLYAEAEPLLLRALVINETSLGANHPDIAIDFDNLAGLYESQGRYMEAERLYQRTIIIFEESLGSSHPDTATAYRNYAILLQDLGRSEEAEQMLFKAQEIRQRHADLNSGGSNE